AFDKAAEAYQESLARDPNPPDGQEIRVELARCLFLQRKFDESLAALGTSDSADAWLLRGECSYANGKVEEAGRCASEALKRDAQDADVLAFKATLAAVAGNQREAADLLAKAVRQKPNEYQLRYRLVQAYRRVGENNLADEQEKGLEDLRKKQDELHDLIAQASQDIGDVQLRYRIATIAQFLGMSEMSNQWLKAARMIEIANAGLVNQPTILGGIGPLGQGEPKTSTQPSP
ncbi:MAG TPA: tetratricopeptide repeat protein, partial [Pirellulales bacterium]|nr:tetratricopeptide repeat protein [Pirellulales bacterium]